MIGVVGDFHVREVVEAHLAPFGVYGYCIPGAGPLGLEEPYRFLSSRLPSGYCFLWVDGGIV